jgi:hypothetical protein
VPSRVADMAEGGRIWQRHGGRKRGPIGEAHMSVNGERKDIMAIVHKLKEKMNSTSVPRHLGPAGLSGEAASGGEDRAGVGSPRPVGPEPRKNSNGN